MFSCSFRLRFAFGAAAVDKTAERGERREATANVEHGHGRRMLLSASSFGQISPLDGGRRMAAPIRISIGIGISNVTHPVPSEPSRTSRKWNFSTSAVIITACVCVRVCFSCLLWPRRWRCQPAIWALLPLLCSSFAGYVCLSICLAVGLPPA